MGIRQKIAIAILLIVAADARAQEPAQPEAILETGELMLMVVKPAYDELKTAMTKPPADRKEWAVLYQKAARLAEFENLILFRPHERANTPQWKTLATNARKATMTLASEVLKSLAKTDSADFQAVRKTYENVSAGCNACHRANSREAPVIKP